MSERPGGKRPGGREAFTDRQIERMQYLREEADLPFKEIGRLMGCSVSTVRLYFQRNKAPFLMRTDAERPEKIEG